MAVCPDAVSSADWRQALNAYSVLMMMTMAGIACINARFNGAYFFVILWSICISEILFVTI